MNKRQEKYLLIAVVVIVAALLLSFTVVGKAKKVNLGTPAPPLIPNDPYGTGKTPSSSSPMDNPYNPTAAAVAQGDTTAAITSALPSMGIAFDAAKYAYDGALSYFGHGQPATPPAADTAGVTPVVNSTGVTLTPKQSTAYNMAILSGNFDLANSILNFPGMPAPGYNP